MILTPEEMQAAEKAVFAQGVEAEPLMEKAGFGIARAICRRWPMPGRAIAYLGTGHNAGDALVAGRHLLEAGWNVALREVEPNIDRISPLTRKKRAQFLAVKVTRRWKRPRPLIHIDGLLGIGARGPLRARFLDLAEEMNRSRSEDHAWTVALDLPSGLDGVTGEPQTGCVIADLTLTIACAKSGLLADAATSHVGMLELVPLPEITPPSTAVDAGGEVLTPALMQFWWRRRPVNAYKNQMGHVAVIAGSPGYVGAAEMTAQAALTSGAGLVTLLVPESLYPIVAARTPPEVMVAVRADDNHLVASLSENTADVFAFGPGIGSNAAAPFIDWLETEQRPIVVDADGLNLIARHASKLTNITQAGPRLFTPHPGEFKRLFPAHSELPTRRDRADHVVADYPLTLLYKGTRSLIAEQGQVTAYNLTGNPGMASGGMGDVLTGVCAGLAAQGYALYHSACLGAWLCGTAADTAVVGGGETYESLRATHVLQNLSTAMNIIGSGD